jgi:hypothetical protein
VIAPAARDRRAEAAEAPASGATATAVLESQPLLGFPGEAGATRFGARAQVAPEPPPFGFNAPGRGEGEAAVEVDSPAPPSFEWPATAPDRAATQPRPYWAPAPRPAAPPRELMPTSIPAYRPRLGEGPTPTFGPPGRHRSVAAVVVLSVLTLGWYAVAWHRQVNQEMGDFDPRVHVRPARSAWAVALPLLAGVLATAAAGAVVALDHFNVSTGVPIRADQAVYGLGALLAVPYLLLLLPFGAVAVAMTAERVRCVEEHAGVTADEQVRPAAVVGWLLLPVVGGFVAMGRQQRSLNRIWDLARE